MAEPSLARLRALFEAVVDLPEAQRAARLESLEADPALVERVLRMARECDTSITSDVTRLQRRMAGITEPEASPELGVGDTLGVWKLVDVLGQGGMGAVFLAERADGHFRQRAAIKLLRGQGSAVALRLLATERQILAQLSHPNIARLLDGGATPLGRPYLVMEYVDGQRLDRFLLAQAPSLTERLALFREICAPVAFAHSQLVVHCDLKPSNVLIDREQRPVLLDFGIARLLDAAPESGGMAKAYTPGFASPELQQGEAVGTSTDVFSLGVLLKVILGERDAADPDLAAIVARATRELPGERYASVQALSEDVDRYLHRFPVQARRPTAGYRLKRLLQRRWPAFSAAAGVLLLLLGAGWQLKQERDRALLEAARADREAATASAINDFLESIIAGADVQKEGSREMTVVEMVDRGFARIGAELADQPAIQATLYERLARVYDHLGRLAEGREGFRLAIEVERRVQPPRPQVLSNLLRSRAVALANEQRYADAEALAREALALAEAHADPVSRDVGQSATALALSLGNSGHEEARQMLLRHLEIRKALGEPDIDLASTWHNLGLNAMRAGWLEEAEEYLDRSWAVRRDVLGPGHARTLNGASLLGELKMRLGRFDEAIALNQEVLTQARAIYAENSARVLSAEAELASSLSEAGRFTRAMSMQQDVVVRVAATDLRGSATHARFVNNLATHLERAGLLAPAADTLRESLRLRLEVYAPDDPAVARVQGNLGRVLMEAGALDEALDWLRAADLTRAAKLQPDHVERLEGELLLAEHAWRSGNPGEAAAWLEDSASRWAAAPYLPGRTSLRRRLLEARTAVAAGRDDAAERTEAYRVEFDTLHPAGDPWRLPAELALLELRKALGQPVEAAAAMLQQQFDALPESYPADSDYARRLRVLRG